MLMDENNLSADDFQRLTNNICSSYARATRAVSLGMACRTGFEASDLIILGVSSSSGRLLRRSSMRASKVALTRRPRWEASTRPSERVVEVLHGKFTGVSITLGNASLADSSTVLAVNGLIQ